MLTGRTRYRLGWRKKMVLQVSEWLITYPSHDYSAVWRDATFRDALDLERQNFSKDAPRPVIPPRPPRANRDRLQEVAPVEPAEVGGIEYRFMGQTGYEE